MKNKLLVSLLCATAICSTAFAMEGITYLPISSKKSRGGLEFVERKDAEEAFQRLHSYVALLHYNLDKAFERIKVLEDVTFKGDRNARKAVKEKLGFETKAAQALGQRSRTSSIDLQDMGDGSGEFEGAGLAKRRVTADEILQTRLGKNLAISNTAGQAYRARKEAEYKASVAEVDQKISANHASYKALKSKMKGASSDNIREQMIQEAIQYSEGQQAAHARAKAPLPLQDEGRDRADSFSTEASISDVDSSRTFVAPSVRSQNAPNFVPPPPPARVSQRTSSGLESALGNLSIEEDLSSGPLVMPASSGKGVGLSATRTDSRAGLIAGGGKKELTPLAPVAEPTIEYTTSDEKTIKLTVAQLAAAKQMLVDAATGFGKVAVQKKSDAEVAASYSKADLKTLISAM